MGEERIRRSDSFQIAMERTLRILCQNRKGCGTRKIKDGASEGWATRRIADTTVPTSSTS